MTSIFGQILTGRDVEQAVHSTLETWLPTYLREIERQNDIPTDALPNLASTVTANAFAQFQDAPLPSLIVICPGSEGAPEIDGDGNYFMWWTVGLAIIVEAVDDTAARALAQFYSGALMALFVQHPSLGGFASRMKLGVITADDAPDDFVRAGCGVVRVVFSVLVERVVTALAGPTAPDPDPQDWPQVATVHIDAERLT